MGHDVVHAKFTDFLRDVPSGTPSVNRGVSVTVRDRGWAGWLSTEILPEPEVRSADE